ncbi:hypothetical protein SCUCBS95973_001494 [Sporothrix curviconia]|uniref:Glycosyl transferase CAP10 domain-containing protein n=1 Tax=Sporothrix curviconia TaxID=1260050 RepID=A0ABP0AZ66_9PEZI
MSTAGSTAAALLGGIVAEQLSSQPSSPRLDLRDSAFPLAWRMVVLLVVANAVDIYLFGPLFLYILHTVALGLARAVFWFSLTTTIVNRTDFNACTTLLSCLLSLSQTITTLPRDTRFTSTLYLFALIPLVPSLLSLAAVHGIYPPPATLSHHEHPVVGLMREARTQFKDLVARQSQNLTAAADEYRRRYGIDPPPGFDQWFSFAQQQESPIINDFDMIHGSLAPIRVVLSGKDIQKQMQTVYNHPDSDVWRCTFSATTHRTTCTHPSRTFNRHVHDTFDLLLGGGGGNRRVPPLAVDVTFLVNHLDEPRVLLPADGGEDKSMDITHLSHQPVWDILTRNYIHATKDLCQHPAYRTMHGMLQSPVSFPLIQGFVPILSSGALSNMGDILYPSPAYHEPAFLYDATHDRPFAQKAKPVYWAGSTTGGYAVANGARGWKTFQRQHVVDLAAGYQPHMRLSDRGGQVRRERRRHPNGRLWDVAFTRIFQCDHRACRAQRSRFHPRPWAPADAALQAQLVVGVDGNGISGRYMKLLASGSAPLKQTLLREWHDERLVPWVHYFPLSQSLEETPELVAFLLTTEAGQGATRTVANEGQRP